MTSEVGDIIKMKPQVYDEPESEPMIASARTPREWGLGPGAGLERKNSEPLRIDTLKKVKCTLQFFYEKYKRNLSSYDLLQHNHKPGTKLKVGGVKLLA